MLLAISTMSPDATATLLVLGFVAFVVAALIAFILSERGIWSGAGWLCSGLALVTFVGAWNALAAT